EEMTFTDKVTYVEASLQVYFSEILYPGDTMDVPLTSDVFGGTLTYTPVGTYASGLDFGGSTMMVNEGLGNAPYIVDVEVMFALDGESTIFIIQIVVDDGTVTPMMMVIAEQLQDVTIMGVIVTVIDGVSVICDNDACMYVEETLDHQSGEIVILRGSYQFDGTRHVLTNITREDSAPSDVVILPLGMPTSMLDLMSFNPMMPIYAHMLILATGIVTFDPDRPYPFMLEGEGGVLPIDTDGYHLWAELDLRIGIPTSITGPVMFVGEQLVIRPIDDPARLITPHMDNVELMTWIEQMVTMHEPIVLEANTYAPFPTVLQPLGVTILYAVTSDPTDAFNTLTRRAGVVDADETVDVLMAVYREGVWIGSLNLTVTVLAPTVLTVEQFYDAPLGTPVFVRADTYLRTNSLIMIQDATGFAYINKSSYTISMGQDVLLYGFKDELNGLPVLSSDTAVAKLYGDALGHGYDIMPRTISDIIDLDPSLGSSYLMPHEVTGTVVVETEGMMRWFYLEHLDQRLAILSDWEGEEMLWDLVGLNLSMDLYYVNHYADWVDEMSMIYLGLGEGIDVRLANVNASEMAGLYASWIESTIHVAYESDEIIPFDFSHPLYSGDVVWTHGNPDDSGYVDLISGTITAPDLTEPKTITLILEVTSVVAGVTHTHQATISFDIVPGMSVTLDEFLSGEPFWATFDATVVAYSEQSMMLSDNTGSIFINPMGGMYFGPGELLRVTGIRTVMGNRFFVADGYQIEPIGWEPPSGGVAPAITFDDLNALAPTDPYNYGLPVSLSGTVMTAESDFEGWMPTLTDGVTTIKVIGDYGIIWEILEFENFRVSIDGYLYDHQDGTWTLSAFAVTPDDYDDQELLDIFMTEIIDTYDRTIWYGGTAPMFPLFHDVFSGIAASYHGIGDFASLYNLGTMAFENINHEVHIRIEVTLETMTLTETFEILIDLQPPVPDTTIEDFLNWGIDGDRYTMIATVVQNTYDELILTDGSNILTMNAYNWTVGRGDTILVTGTRETVNGRIQLGPDSIVLTYVDHPGFDLPDPIFVPYQSVFMPDDPIFFYRYLTLKGRLVFNAGINSYQLVDGNQAITIRYQGNAGTFLSQNQGAIVTLDVTIYQFDDTFVVFYLGTGSDIMLIG
ncbi:MAG: hypothetical protein K9K93_05050, partial [Acholeplasmataceae bacterium]|nr:hypothetical protein [Acholeplasmataceae bacterium]